MPWGAGRGEESDHGQRRERAVGDSGTKQRGTQRKVYTYTQEDTEGYAKKERTRAGGEDRERERGEERGGEGRDTRQR